MDKISALIPQVREVTGFTGLSNEEILLLGLQELLRCMSGCPNCSGPEVEFMVFDPE